MMTDAEIDEQIPQEPHEFREMMIRSDYTLVCKLNEFSVKWI